MTEDGQNADIVSLEGPLEELDGKLVLLIPLDVGGAALASCARGIAQIEGEVLRVDIPDWLATKFKLQIGSLVLVDNIGGKFNLRPSPDCSENSDP